jgi:hypothetical protein
MHLFIVLFAGISARKQHNKKINRDKIDKADRFMEKKKKKKKIGNRATRKVHVQEGYVINTLSYLKEKKNQQYVIAIIEKKKQEK